MHRGLLRACQPPLRRCSPVGLFARRLSTVATRPLSTLLVEEEHARDEPPSSHEPLSSSLELPHSSHVHGHGRKLCSMGTGEVVHILAWQAKDEGSIPDFERRVQGIARKLHDMEAGVSDVRVCHPRCGEATFVITVVSSFESQRFESQIAPQIAHALRDVSLAGTPTFRRAGTLMPQAHSLSSLLAQLQKQVGGSSHAEHDIAGVKNEIGKWFPRREEYEQYIHWDEHNPEKYTRNLIFSSEKMEVLLMCWPAHVRSAIHCHGQSSCWVASVEGQVHEVQYQMPTMDRKFRDLMNGSSTPGAVGRCGPLKVSNVVALGLPDSPMDSYANNDIGVHRLENRTDLPAITLHVYAPPLHKMSIYREAGDYSIASVGKVTYMSEGGNRTGRWGKDTDPDGIIDVEKWNSE
ncbi:RmlC-like cupin domain-containing protein [Pavlovales sp. CCMP2436]|nr:RmlC-like cupin domain-containing protein [Pavlovales sp. CCMP2436]|mmetsp:Transcript_15494/g.39342  ORF Transcript_15494/g.39342 Transcript_15494/m.39342 type:complete len:407 (-) Transcript_15494:208-1428(-)